MSWLAGTIADNTSKSKLTKVQKKRNKSKAYQKSKRNAVVQARLKGKPVGRAIRTFEKKKLAKQRKHQRNMEFDSLNTSGCLNQS